MKPRVRFTLFILTTLHLPLLQAEESGGFIAGRVTADDGTGVPYANIYLENRSRGTTSDRDGRFLLLVEGISSKNVIVSHSSFVPDTLNIEMINASTIEIKLRPKTYRFDPVVIYGNLYGQENLHLPVNHRALDFSSAPSSGVGIGEKVDRYGIQVRDYGGPAGLKTISSPTGYSEHILILLDGFPLNSAQNGVFDLSSLPVEFFGQGELYPGQGSSLYGSHAVGGTLNLLPAGPGNFLKVRSGSLGDKGFSGETSLRLGDSRVSLYGNSFESEGNYRENNRFAQTAIGTKLRLPNAAKWSVSSHILATQTKRGIPGSLQFPSPKARKEKDEIFTIVTGRTVSQWGHTELMSGASSSDEHFTNPDWAMDSRHQLTSGMARLLHRFENRSRFTNTVSVELGRINVNSDDAGNRTVTEGAAGLLSQFSFGKAVTLSPSVRLDWDDHSRSGVFTGNIAFLWSPATGPFRSATISSGTSYRAPTFNDLFWEDASGYSMGNPDLEPEQGVSTNLKVNLKPMKGGFIHGSVTAAHYAVNNLIQWAPNEAWVYSPYNVLKSKSTVLGLMVTAAPKRLPIRVIVGLETTDSKVLTEGTEHGKQLLYVPPASQWTEVQLKIGQARGHLSFRNLGPRRYSYTDDASLDGYRRLDASVSLNLPQNGFDVAVEGGARNLLDDRELQSVYDYPEPGRIIFVTMGVSR
ncbi:MAG: TonB-dependent receptor plug domain-containing protein [Candidatus Neomarinimicrobiota bacterium]|nr:TonB-dependent receptor plug domain-containing protein [Candidatus Neomarinimicrobiota bacterium]